MNGRVFWLRVSYWAGAIIDAVAAIPLIFPWLASSVYKWSSFTSSPELRSVSGVGASLMLGWTALLLWADRKPVERKGVLLLTILPVIFGIVLNEIVDLDAQLISMEAVLPVWILQAGLVVLFTFSYLNARETNA